MFWKLLFGEPKKQNPIKDVVRSDDIERGFEEIPYTDAEMLQLATEKLTENGEPGFMRSDDPPMDDDYVPAPYVKPEPVPIAVTPALIRTIDEFLQEEKEKKMAETATPSSKYYALYYFDGENYAVGPFTAQREARLWLSGFKTGTDGNDEFSVLGVASDIVDFGGINFETPDLGT